MVSPVLLSAISLNRKLIRKRQGQVDASSYGSSCYSLVDSTRTRVLAIKLNSKGMSYASVITLWSEAGCPFLAATPRQTDRQTDRQTYRQTESPRVHTNSDRSFTLDQETKPAIDLSSVGIAVQAP